MTFQTNRLGRNYDFEWESIAGIFERISLGHLVRKMFDENRYKFDIPKPLKSYQAELKV
jgi:hypothetical protein